MCDICCRDCKWKQLIEWVNMNRTRSLREDIWEDQWRWRGDRLSLHMQSDRAVVSVCSMMRCTAISITVELSKSEIETIKVSCWFSFNWSMTSEGNYCGADLWHYHCPTRTAGSVSGAYDWKQKTHFFCWQWNKKVISEWQLCRLASALSAAATRN